MINERVRGVVNVLFFLFYEKKALRENVHCAHDITYEGHYEKSLYSDNDPGCYSREMKIISSDWIALLRRLLNKNNLLGGQFSIYLPKNPGK